MVIASAILVAGILVAGCTDSSSSGQAASTASTDPAQAAVTADAGNSNTAALSATPDQAVNIGNKPAFNQSAGPQGTPPGGMMMNGTRPSGTPPAGMEMNGTRPSGTPPSGTLPSQP